MKCIKCKKELFVLSGSTGSSAGGWQASVWCGFKIQNPNPDFNGWSICFIVCRNKKCEHFNIVKITEPDDWDYQKDYFKYK